MNNKFCERFRQVLEDNGISQKAFAKKIGMSQGVINNYCTGKREPSLDALLLICKELGESADFLLGVKD